MKRSAKALQFLYYPMNDSITRVTIGTKFLGSSTKHNKNLPTVLQHTNHYQWQLSTATAVAKLLVPYSTSVNTLKMISYSVLQFPQLEIIT